MRVSDETIVELLIDIRAEFMAFPSSSETSPLGEQHQDTLSHIAY